MSDPLRTDSPRPPDGTTTSDREAKIEQLLLAGLDHYFSAEYEQAINVWTRALFLDRNHQRARAYIERARSALAERQRESEELLQNGVAAFDRGEGELARRLLNKAISSGAPADEALAVLSRLDRLDQSATPPSQPATPTGRRGRPSRQAAAAARGSRTAVLVWIGLGVFAVAGGLAWAGSRPIWQTLFSSPSGSAPVTPASASDAALPVPRRGEMALARAQALVAGGHLRDALSALSLVRPTDAEKSQADRLRADIQRQLIGLTLSTPSRPDLPKSDRRP